MLEGRDPRKSDEDPGDLPPRVSKEKLKEFVLGVLDGTLFVSAQVKDKKILPIVFLPLALGGFEGWKESQVKNIGVFYARMSSALPRGINGYPCFPEMRILHQEDWARAAHAIQREHSRREKIEI